MELLPQRRATTENGKFEIWNANCLRSCISLHALHSCSVVMVVVVVVPRSGGLTLGVFLSPFQPR